MSKTIMLVESAGRPNHYVSSRNLKNLMWEENSSLKQPGQGGGLTDYQWVDGGTPGNTTGNDGLFIVWDRTTSPGPMPTDIASRCPLTTVMNCDNYKGVYSFHSGGCNVVFGDGSVSFIKEDVDADTFISLITRGGGDQAGDY
jgi:prepilin-type processing-associated H-X9-DG protein